MIVILTLVMSLITAAVVGSYSEPGRTDTPYGDPGQYGFFRHVTARQVTFVESSRQDPFAASDILDVEMQFFNRLIGRRMQLMVSASAEGVL